MSGPRPIAVVLAADTGFAKQLAVAIAGISKSATCEHQVFVLHDGYDTALIDQVSASAGNAVEIRFLDARSSSLNDAQLPWYLPTATLFRLRIGSLLPDEIERVIYIDADVTVRRPLDELWDTDLDGCALGAVRDPVVPWAAAPAGLPWTEIGVAPDTPYFNAGVLVVDISTWRSQRISEDALQFLNRRRFRYADQCALNTVVAGAWTPIGPQWNLQAGHLAGRGSLAWVTEPRDTLASAIEDPAIVHFNTSSLGRPWQHGCIHPYRDLWFEHLDLTPWAGWRPPKPSRTREIVRRIRRAGRILIRG
jgi:lipopolysaccharide biosynthesis glycosyltransferase